jgi:hypothetical protein
MVIKLSDVSEICTRLKNDKACSQRLEVSLVYFRKILLCLAQERYLDMSLCQFLVYYHPHDGLRVKLFDYGAAGKLWLLLDNMYNNLSSSVLCNGILSKWFKHNRGVRQGSALSAKLYLKRFRAVK